MSDGLEALRDLAHRKRRERFAEIACDTRRAFAFFAAMRPRLARKRLESRAAGVSSLLRVRSCFRTLRAQARRGKIVREISRSANRRHARRALRALQLLKLRGVERRIALLRADRVAKASAARRSVRAFVEGAAFNRTSRRAALLADAAARAARPHVLQFSDGARGRPLRAAPRRRLPPTERRPRSGIWRRSRPLGRRGAIEGGARRWKRRAPRGRGLAALKALVERGRTRSAATRSRTRPLQSLQEPRPRFFKRGSRARRPAATTRNGGLRRRAGRGASFNCALAPPRRRDCPFEASDAEGRAVEEAVKAEAARRAGCVVGAAARQSGQ